MNIAKGRFADDLTGRRFARWTVASRAENYSNGQARWNVVCDCSSTSMVMSHALRSGKSTMCRTCAARNTAARREQAEAGARLLPRRVAKPLKAPPHVVSGCRYNTLDALGKLPDGVWLVRCCICRHQDTVPDEALREGSAVCAPCHAPRAVR